MAALLAHKQLLPPVLGGFVEAQLGTRQEAFGTQTALEEKQGTYKHEKKKSNSSFMFNTLTPGISGYLLISHQYVLK